MVEKFNFELGDLVQVISVDSDPQSPLLAYVGEIGEVVGVKKSPIRLPSGILLDFKDSNFPELGREYFYPMWDDLKLIKKRENKPLWRV